MIRYLLPVLLLTGCAAKPAPPPYRCDATGRVIITTNLTLDQQVDATTSNLRLSELRLRKMQGEPYLRPDMLEKADLCPGAAT